MIGFVIVSYSDTRPFSRVGGHGIYWPGRVVRRMLDPAVRMEMQRVFFRRFISTADEHLLARVLAGFPVFGNQRASPILPRSNDFRSRRKSISSRFLVVVFFPTAPSYKLLESINGFKTARPLNILFNAERVVLV